MSKPTTIRLRPLGGQWQTVGTARTRGVWAQDVQMTADRRGSLSASFELHRDPAVLWPDLGPLTPVEIEIAGVVVWYGRLKETPSRSSDYALSVQCEGLQAHLDDDVYLPGYVHTRLADWKDIRSAPTADLSLYTTAWQLQAESSAITIGMSDQVISGTPRGGVYFDAVSPRFATRVVIDWQKNQWAGTATARLGSSVTIGATTAIATLTDTATSGSTAITVAGTPTLAIFCDTDQWQSPDRFFKITGIRTFTSVAYESGGQSVLKASTVVTDALAQATTELNPDRTRIGVSTFNIPDLWSTDDRTPREIIDTVQAYHDYTFKLDNLNRPVFRPKTTVARVRIGAWSAATFDDQSSNSSDDIYSDVVVTGQTPAGDPVRVRRTRSDSQLVNEAPSFDPLMPDTTGSYKPPLSASTRSGLKRTRILQVASPLPGDLVLAKRIADVWLAGHTTTPFKGSVRVVGDRAVRTVATDLPVPPERLLMMTDDLLRFDDRVDPDTGGHGREGRISQVTYTPATDEAVVSIDDTRSSLDGLLARLAIVQGAG